jgi:asparagine synthase (glutamine-hydrolysing)
VSVQFGKWNFDGRSADREYLAKAGEMVAPYGPDGGDTYIKDSVGILYRAFYTTKESREEIQPLVTPSGAVLTWDGRLDNRAELIHDSQGIHDSRSTDVSIVAGAYERWGTGCFAKLIGDWALSIWNPTDRSLILAKDPIGTRHLYYTFDQEQVCWSTVLDPLVLLAGKTVALEEEYIAGWLSFFPATHLTPYVGIHSVPPSSSVLMQAGKHTVSKYWDFDPGKRIRYRTDAEYEEHFRAVFKESVRRRLRSESPILAELSGGMDSSSIVCMADIIIASGVAETLRLDTISYFNDFEPNWNERPYFTKVEERRGRTGTHIDVGSQESSKFEFETDRFMATPGSGGGRPSETNRQFTACMLSHGNRVVLSGIGGDEVTGGVPTSTPELEDLLVRGQFRTLVHQLKAWALSKRKPWFYLFFEAARGFFPQTLVGVPKHKRPAPWLNPKFAKRNRAALQGYETRTRVLGPLPTFQGNLGTLDVLRRQLACNALSASPPQERGYPYLDRSLLEFLYAVPCEQLVRPGQRRSLMRRALVNIVPDELLNRKRKAFAARGPLANISAQLASLLEFSRSMLASSLGIIDSAKFIDVLEEAGHGQQVPVVYLMRTLGVELWLRNLRDSKVLANSGSLAESLAIPSILKAAHVTRRQRREARLWSQLRKERR